MITARMIAEAIFEQLVPSSPVLNDVEHTLTEIAETEMHAHLLTPEVVVTLNDGRKFSVHVEELASDG